VPHNQCFEDIERSRTELRKTLDNLERLEKVQERAMKDMELSSQALEAANEAAAKDPAKKPNADKVLKLIRSE
jgi:hypothetical protein